MPVSPALYIGLMSGTSIDGADAALMDYSQADAPRLLATHGEPPPDDLRDQLLQLSQQSAGVSLTRFGELNQRIGHWFADAACALIDKACASPADVGAIGSHGQTIRHEPNATYPFSLQMGSPSVIAARTGCRVIADFRSSDIAVGGQGAPLVCAFHDAVLSHPTRHRVVLNIGGIANITVIPAGQSDAAGQIIGFDTGPGNALLDLWVAAHLDTRLDHGGEWAAGGCIDNRLLDEMLGDAYLRRHPPKSTGREYFNMDWLRAKIDGVANSTAPADVQATLCEFTAISIALAIQTYAPLTEEILVCGGGARNPHLLGRIQKAATPTELRLTDDYGIDADWVEAIAFAWLARQTLSGKPGNLPAVTGARMPAVLGAIYQPPR